MFAPSATEMHRYQEELAEWRAVCEEMSDAEQNALSALAPSGCELCQYWSQQCVGFGCEVPCRIAYHTACMSSSYCCCLSTCDPGRELWQHHAMAVQEYWWLTRILAENLCSHPCTPWYVYAAEVGLRRPPKPTPPKDCCDDCCAGPSCDCDCDCSCERVVYHVNRQLRSMLCTFAGVHSCHPSQCIGPCPCLAWQRASPSPHDKTADCDEDSPADDAAPPSLLPQASYTLWHKRREEPSRDEAAEAADACCGAPLCLVETLTARHLRWSAEYDRARRERTEAFYARRAATAKGEPVPSCDYAEFVPTGEPSPPEIEGDAHLSERIQGRVAAALLLGCCCAGVAAGVHGLMVVG